jgi:hypothetical protein
MENMSSSVELLREVDNYSGNKIRKREDLQILFEEALKKGNEGKLDELSFTAKYVQGLKRVMQQAQKNNEIGDISNIKKDYSASISKVYEQIRELLEESNEGLKGQFEATYLQMTQESFQNLNYLLEDLEWTKKYINQQKRSPKN